VQTFVVIIAVVVVAYIVLEQLCYRRGKTSTVDVSYKTGNAEADKMREHLLALDSKFVRRTTKIKYAHELLDYAMRARDTDGEIENLVARYERLHIDYPSVKRTGAHVLRDSMVRDAGAKISGLWHNRIIEKCYAALMMLDSEEDWRSKYMDHIATCGIPEKFRCRKNPFSTGR